MRPSRCSTVRSQRPSKRKRVPSSRTLLGSLFEFEDLGAQDLKGITGPVRAWVALRPSSVESRFEAFHGAGLTELVGREEELQLLLRRWSKAKNGEGQVVLLSGEAGIGKSRLIAALLESLATEPHTRLRNFCSPQHTDSALYPVIGQWTSPASTAKSTPSSAVVAPKRLRIVCAPTATSFMRNCSRCATVLRSRKTGQCSLLAAAVESVSRPGNAGGPAYT